MADTLPNISLPANTWVDLYSVTGITVGVQLLVQNIGITDIFLAAQAAQPVNIGAHQIIRRETFAVNEIDDVGAWVYSPAYGGLVNARLA